MNKSGYIDYQDCKYLGRREMLCSGLNNYQMKKDGPRFPLGGFEIVDLRTDQVIAQMPIELWAESGFPMTQNPFWIEATATGFARISCRRTASRRSTSTRRTSSSRSMDRYDFCRALARDAGKLAHRGFGTSATTMKGRHDVVTAMDSEVERFIRAAIAKRYPQDAIIGEEEGGGVGDRLWLIDPIDGTANYARGIAALLRVDRLPRARRARRSARSTIRATTGCTRPRGAKAPGAMASGSRSARSPK